MGLLTYDYKTKQYTFKCHHGENECLGNKYFLCFTDILGRVNAYSFIICMELNVKKFKGDFKSIAQKCTENFANLGDLVPRCAEGPKRSYLMHLSGKKTPSKMHYTRWVEVDGKHDKNFVEEIFTSINNYLCSKDRKNC